mgnify:FL=1|tara:strand:- start:785 stop:1096 length:312 start_codon:yes stop_codon:yes gene_type:complete
MKFNLLTTEQLRYLKRNVFNAKQKTYIKKCEQTSGELKYKIDGITYILKYEASRAYTNYVFGKLKHNDVGVMNRGGGPLLQDKYGKVNYEADKIARKIDKKQL